MGNIVKGANDEGINWRATVAAETISRVKGAISQGLTPGQAIERIKAESCAGAAVWVEVAKHFNQ
jgi:hypothetical protein